MFSNNTVFVIHPKNKPCGQQLKNSSDTLNDQVFEFIKNTYPKQKYLAMVFKILQPLNLIDNNLFFTSFPNIHVADFCSFINNKFEKNGATDQKFIKLCKYLRSKQIKFPKIAIKNPVAQKYVCAWTNTFQTCIFLFPDFKIKWTVPKVIWFNANLRCFFHIPIHPKIYRRPLYLCFIFRTVFFNARWINRTVMLSVTDPTSWWAMWTMPSVVLISTVKTFAYLLYIK